jgi:hypothetical protein
MSIYVTSQVWKNAPVDGSALLVLLALADFADDDGVCWPAVCTIAQKARISERSAQRSIRKMADDGLIEIDDNAGPKGANRYRVKPVTDWPKSDEEPAESEPEGGDNLAPPQNDEGVTPVAQGVTPVTSGGDTGVTRTVIEPSLNPPEERERASANGREGQDEGNAKPDSATVPGAADFEKRVMRFCNGRGFDAGAWPDWDTSSLGWIAKQFAKLCETDRQHAERWRDAYLRDIATRKRKPVPVGTFFRDRLWQGLDPELLVRAEKAAAQGAKPAEHAKPDGWAISMGPVWSACLHEILLAGPEHPEHAPQNGLWLRFNLQRAWPKVAKLYDMAQAKRGFTAPERLHALKDGMQFVKSGTDDWASWEAEYRARGWPEWPRRDGMDGMYFPAGGPDGLAAFIEAVASHKSPDTGNCEAAE